MVGVFATRLEPGAHAFSLPLALVATLPASYPLSGRPVFRVETRMSGAELTACASLQLRAAAAATWRENEPCLFQAACACNDLLEQTELASLGNTASVTSCAPAHDEDDTNEDEALLREDVSAEALAAISSAEITAHRARARTALRALRAQEAQRDEPAVPRRSLRGRPARAAELPPFLTYYTEKLLSSELFDSQSENTHTHTLAFPTGSVGAWASGSSWWGSWASRRWASRRFSTP